MVLFSMAESTELVQIVERAVKQALAGQIPTLQAELVKRVLEALPAAAPAPPQAAGPNGNTGALLRDIASIHAGTTQKEILRGLLAGGSEHCGRIALFVVKAGTAAGWQKRAFSAHADPQGFSRATNDRTGM